MLACFNTCVGLIACVGEYFHTLLSRIPYPALAAFFAAASMLIANLGLADILRLSVPMLNALYPVAIVLITLSFVPGLEQRRRVYPLCIALAAFFAAASMLIANLGLADILRLSVPMLNALYPVAIVLITLSFVPGLEQRRRVYPLCIGCTAVQSIAAALPLGTLSALANALPLAALGFGWVLPAAAGLLAGIFLSCTEE